MNESLYNNFEAVKELNRVDGFDPTKVMRRIVEPMEDGTSSERCYLDVAYRKLWFRLKYPQGAIKKFVREITDQFAIVEAKVYLDRSDPADNYIANAIVKRKTSWGTSILNLRKQRLLDVLLQTPDSVSSSQTAVKVWTPM